MEPRSQGRGSKGLNPAAPVVHLNGIARSGVLESSDPIRRSP